MHLPFCCIKLRDSLVTSTDPRSDFTIYSLKYEIKHRWWNMWEQPWQQITFSWYSWLSTDFWQVEQERFVPRNIFEFWIIRQSEEKLNPRWRVLVLFWVPDSNSFTKICWAISLNWIRLRYSLILKSKSNFIEFISRSRS